MIKNCKESDRQEVLNYIGDNYYKSLYLYLNFCKYSIDEGKIKVYIQYNKDNKEIISILLIYGYTLHIFSNSVFFEENEIIELIKKENIKVVCSEKRIIDILNKFYNNKKDIVSYGNVWELKDINYPIDDCEKIEILNSDYEKLVDFLLQDSNKKLIYTKESLLKQLLDRKKTKYGRNYVIKNGDIIIAHAGTGAEIENIAVVNFVMTEVKERGKGLASQLVKKLCYDLVNEGKKCYLMTLHSEVEKLYERVGFSKVSSYGKIVLHEEE